MILKPFLRATVVLTFALYGAVLGALVTGLITADVRLRTAPNGTPTDTLKAGTVVGILKVQGAWAQVMYLPDNDVNKAKTGWVPSKYVKQTGGGGRSSGNCETEFKTNAEVCVESVRASLDCDKNFEGDSYTSCDVQVRYDIETTYSGGSYLDVDLSCRVEIEYTGPGMYRWSSDYSSQSDSFSLFAYGSESGSMSFDFSFGAFEKVTRVKVGSAHCEIESVNLW